LNYTNQIKEFLTTEKQVFNTYISNNKYITLIEVGCGIGENVDIALKNNMNYTGLDFAAGKIIKCRKKL
jgi:cyclopropane fatty-acyl-phospholipid synthase-like methyltransferase